MSLDGTQGTHARYGLWGSPDGLRTELHAVSRPNARYTTWRLDCWYTVHCGRCHDWRASRIACERALHVRVSLRFADVFGPVHGDRHSCRESSSAAGVVHIRRTEVACTMTMRSSTCASRPQSVCLCLLLAVALCLPVSARSENAMEADSAMVRVVHVESVVLWRWPAVRIQYPVRSRTRQDAGGTCSATRRRR
jgi:hypothetical protein